MSGGITIGFVDVAFFSSNAIAFVALRLGRFWCETGAVTPARADESAIDIYGPLSPNSFQDDHRADGLGPLKAETGVRFPYSNMPRQARDSLFDMCAEHADRGELNRLIEVRCHEVLQLDVGEKAAEREFWLLRAFFFLSDPPAGVWEFLESSSDTIFGIEYRAGRLSSGENVGWPKLSAEKVYRILGIYV